LAPAAQSAARTCASFALAPSTFRSRRAAENARFARISNTVTTLTKAGRYDLREELGRGAMGVVFHGFDPVIGRDVAVKTMHLSEAGTGLTREELVTRFQTEARAAGLLTHPNIVVVYDAGEEQGVFYITMEFVEGRSLQSLIDSLQPFPLPRIMKLMEQVCSALDFAHQHNVVHRDIKPANLMLTADDTVKITDFGTAKILQFGTAQTSHVMGTPSYMSPEQVKGKPIDGRSDIFSLGVILYELTTGEKPFPGQNITTVIYKIINEDPIPPRALDSSIHPGLSAVITRALAKEPGLRYQTCNELLNALKNYHEFTNPEMTIRMAPSAPQIATGATRASIPPVRQPSPPLVPHPNEGNAAAKRASLVTPEAKTPRRGASFLLTVLLLGIIGYAGYRVIPPLKDLWQRAHEAPEAIAVTAKPDADTSPTPPASEAPKAKLEAPTEEAPAISVKAPKPAPAPHVQAIPQKALQPSDLPPTPVKASEPAAPTDVNPEKETAVRKPASPLMPPPAAQLESKLSAELAGLPLSDKVKMQATGNALTLSGSLTLAEHRQLLEHLRTVPSGVRIVDNIEDAEDQPAEPASPAPSSSTGWVWVRSVPPNARIIVDGKETGQRTPARVELQEGDHQVSLVRRGFGSAQRNVQVHAGQTMQFTEFLQ
jgi:serine/threonine protein kinase